MVSTILYYFVLVLISIALIFRKRTWRILKRIYSWKFPPKVLFTGLERELVGFYARNQFENFKKHFIKHQINPNCSDYVKSNIICICDVYSRMELHC